VQKLPGVRTIQWHGDDPPVFPAGAWRYIPAFQVADQAGLARVRFYLTKCGAAKQLPAAVLIDGQRPGEYGGTRPTAPWQRISPTRFDVPVILGGGLTPENVADAVRLVRPYGVDVAGGVEPPAGAKDPAKMRRFIAAACGAVA